MSCDLASMASARLLSRRSRCFRRVSFSAATAIFTDFFVLSAVRIAETCASSSLMVEASPVVSTASPNETKMQLLSMLMTMSARSVHAAVSFCSAPGITKPSSWCLGDPDGETSPPPLAACISSSWRRSSCSSCSSSSTCSLHSSICFPSVSTMRMRSSSSPSTVSKRPIACTHFT